MTVMATKKRAASKPPLRLEWWEADQVEPNPANWRSHPPAQADALRGVIAEVGWAGALLYNERTKRLIDGHLRRDIADGTVPVLVGEWDEKQERTILATLDPIGAMAGADTERLQALLDSVQSENEHVSALLEQLRRDNPLPSLEGATDPDAVPDVPEEPVTKPGDLWLLGEHRLLCGDATNAEDVARLLGGAMAECVAADPPYGMGKQAEGIANDNLQAQKLDAFQMAWWAAWRRRLSTPPPACSSCWTASRQHGRGP